jgi:hypothetical protein
MRYRRILLTALATAAALATGAAQTGAATPEQIADAAWPNSPCHGKTIVDIPKVGIVATDTGLQLIGAASGLAVDDTGALEIPFRAARCETTTDPVAYADMTPADRCQYRVHEAGHLAGLQHPAPHARLVSWQDQIMTANSGQQWYGPCHTVRERARHDIESTVPFGAQVACGRWQGRAFTCVADWADDRGVAFNRRYRVRTRGNAYAIRRVHT